MMTPLPQGPLFHTLHAHHMPRALRTPQDPGRPPRFVAIAVAAGKQASGQRGPATVQLRSRPELGREGPAGDERGGRAGHEGSAGPGPPSPRHAAAPQDAFRAAPGPSRPHPRPRPRGRAPYLPLSTLWPVCGPATRRSPARPWCQLPGRPQQPRLPGTPRGRGGASAGGRGLGRGGASVASAANPRSRTWLSAGKSGAARPSREEQPKLPWTSCWWKPQIMAEVGWGKASVCSSQSEAKVSWKLAVPVTKSGHFLLFCLCNRLLSPQFSVLFFYIAACSGNSDALTGWPGRWGLGAAQNRGISSGPAAGKERCASALRFQPLLPCSEHVWPVRRLHGTCGKSTQNHSGVLRVFCLFSSSFTPSFLF